jgi:hypothetical protein
VEDKLSSEFVFNNPNIKGTCGCGESFHVWNLRTVSSRRAGSASALPEEIMWWHVLRRVAACLVGENKVTHLKTKPMWEEFQKQCLYSL